VHIDTVPDDSWRDVHITPVHISNPLRRNNNTARAFRSRYQIAIYLESVLTQFHLASPQQSMRHIDISRRI
jgi:hypothetical protein